MSESDRKPKVLYIDDDRDFQEICELLFSDYLDITLIDDSNVAMATLERENFDAVITDYDMPGYNGIELLKKIKKVYPDMPVILHTGQGNEGIAREAFLEGASDYFTKDFTGFAYREKILNSVKRAIEASRARKAHRESEEKYRAYIDNAPNSIFVLDGSFHIVDANRASGLVTGCEQKALRGGSFCDLAFPGGEGICSRVLTELESTGKASGEILLSDGDGGFTCLHLDGVRISGNRYIAFCKDISGQKQAEKRLRDSEQTLKSIFRAAPAGIGLVIRGIIQKVNESLCQMTGYQRVDLVGKPVEILYPSQEEFQRADRQMKVQMDLEGTGSLETRWRCGDGELIDVLFSSSPLDVDYPDGGIAFTAVDITRRKADELILRQRLNFEKAISSIMTTFLEEGSPDKVIDEVLEKISRISGADRSYLFQLREMNRTMDNTHEWCAPGVTPQKDRLMGLPTEIFPWWMEQLEAGRIIQVEDVDSMPPAASEEQKILKSQDIFSVLVLPVIVDGRLTGFIGFDNVKGTGHWTSYDLKILQMASNLIGLKQQNEARQRELFEIEMLYRHISEESGDVIWTMDLNLNTTYVSPSVQRLRGFTPLQHQKQTLTEMMTPQSVHKLMDTIHNQLDKKNPENGESREKILTELEYLCNNGKILLTSVEISFIRNPRGDVVGIQGIVRQKPPTG